MCEPPLPPPPSCLLQSYSSDADYYEATGLNVDSDEELELFDPPLTDPGDSELLQALAQKSAQEAQEQARGQGMPFLNLGLATRDLQPCYCLLQP